MKENDIKQAEIKRERNARLIAEVEAANGVALGKKEEQKQKDKEEEMTIVRYNQEKAAREAAKAEEDRKIAEEKEREVARLREMQEKAADRQSEIDALRANYSILLFICSTPMQQHQYYQKYWACKKNGR